MRMYEWLLSSIQKLPGVHKHLVDRRLTTVYELLSTIWNSVTNKHTRSEFAREAAKMSGCFAGANKTRKTENVQLWDTRCWKSRESFVTQDKIRIRYNWLWNRRFVATKLKKLANVERSTMPEMCTSVSRCRNIVDSVKCLPRDSIARFNILSTRLDSSRWDGLWKKEITFNY